MKKTPLLRGMTTFVVSIYCCAIVPVYAQIDDNKTFYQRTDGGVTVVDPDKNIFGNTEYKVRTYDSRESAYQSEYAAEKAIAALAIIAIVEGGKAIYNWWSTPSSSPPTAPAPKEPTRIEQLFGSESAFVQATQAEIERAVKDMRAFATSKTGVMTIGCNIAHEFLKLDDGKSYLVARVSESTNPALKPGDVILRCNRQLKRPGSDLTTLLNMDNSQSGKFSLQILRDGIKQDVFVFARPVEYTASQISDRRTSDAAEAVMLNRLVEVENLQVGWK